MRAIRPAHLLDFIIIIILHELRTNIEWLKGDVQTYSLITNVGGGAKYRYRKIPENLDRYWQFKIEQIKGPRKVAGSRPDEVIF
jgi:hypothetical protein